MPIRYSTILTIILSFWSAGLQAQGYRIAVDVPDLPNQAVILSHRLGLKFYTDDTVNTNDRGKAVFEGAAPLPEGMYQLVFPDKKFVEFFLAKNQEFDISTLAKTPAESLRFNKSPENSRFLKWQQQYAVNRNRAAQIQNLMKNGTLPADSVQLLNKELQQIQQSNNQVWDSAIGDLSGTLAGNFIKGLKPVKVPESIGKTNTTEAQMLQYQFVRSHFFDEIDLTDERLLRTPLIESKLDQYFRQVVPPTADSIIQDAAKIIERVKSAKNTYQFVIQYLFNLYSDPEIMGTDAVYVYIAENYYLNGQAPWIDSANLRGIRYRVDELKPLLLGKVAPPMAGLVGADDQPVLIETIKSRLLVLYFWSPDCGFCKESTPKLFKEYDDLRQMGAEVIAVNTRLDKPLWLKFIADNQLNWINVWSPHNARDLIEKYQAFSTPVLYILDGERRIIAKSISVDQVKPFLTGYLAGD